MNPRDSLVQRISENFVKSEEFNPDLLPYTPSEFSKFKGLLAEVMAYQTLLSLGLPPIDFLESVDDTIKVVSNNYGFCFLNEKEKEIAEIDTIFKYKGKTYFLEVKSAFHHFKNGELYRIERREKLLKRVLGVDRDVAGILIAPSHNSQFVNDLQAKCKDRHILFASMGEFTSESFYHFSKEQFDKLSTSSN